MYLAYDPGKTTGWARFKDNGEADDYGQVDLNDVMDHINAMLVRHNNGDTIRAVIFEDFIIFKHKAPKLVGSRMEASQAIGIIKKLASDSGAKLIQQPSNIKSIAEKWTQLSAKGLSHDKTHWIDAFNHGAYYLINEGIRQTALEEQQKGKT